MLFVLDLGDGDEARFRAYMSDVLTALVSWNVRYLLAHPSTPPLYRAGIAYAKDVRRDGFGFPIPQTWKSIPAVIRRRAGDCKDVAAWRLAELLVKGRRDARLRWIWGHDDKGGLRFHVQIVFDNGRIEDPAKILGMKGDY